MNILVVGCGKLGSQLANVLFKMGHDVAVIDNAPEHFDGLADDFSGYTVTGVPLDQDVLRQAGIEGCDALAAVTDDDNTNIMVCQLAGEIFHVPKVLARIYDPRRSNVFSHFGLNTICPNNLSVDAIYAMLTDHEKIKNIYLDSATVSFEIAEPQIRQISVPLRELLNENDDHKMLFGLMHADGNLTLAHSRSTAVVGKRDRLLYSKVVD